MSEIDVTKGAWQLMETCLVGDYERVDLWMEAYASPRSFGWADAFRVTDAFRKDGKWFDDGGELFQRYITHWMPASVSPNLSGGALPQNGDLSRKSSVCLKSCLTDYLL